MKKVSVFNGLRAVSDRTETALKNYYFPGGKPYWRDLNSRLPQRTETEPTKFHTEQKNISAGLRTAIGPRSRRFLFSAGRDIRRELDIPAFFIFRKQEENHHEPTANPTPRAPALPGDHQQNQVTEHHPLKPENRKRADLLPLCHAGTGGRVCRESGERSLERVLHLSRPLLSLRPAVHPDRGRLCADEQP